MVCTYTHTHTHLTLPPISLSPSSYQQALSAVEMGHHKLQELDVPTTRPEDYFAEMVKTDDHMRKVCFSAPTIHTIFSFLCVLKGEGEIAESAEGVGTERESSEAEGAQKVWQKGCSWLTQSCVIQ